MSRQHGGLGLGLAIVRHLVELHGGTVRAESAGVGQGSTFTIELPRADSDPTFGASGEPRQATAERFPAVAAVRLDGCRALVVDDEEDARELIATVLRTAGATVQTAATVGEALRYLEMSPADVLLADLAMPGTDGYVLIREVRRREAQSGRHLRAAAITAYASAADRTRALAAGFDRHLSKPIGPLAVLEAVRSMWHGADETA